MIRRLLPGALAAMLAGCGYIGDPLPPLLNIPGRVTDLAAVERGAKIIVQFTVPQLSTEGVVLKVPLQLDLRAGAAPDPFDANAWAEGARPLGDVRIEKGLARAEVPVNGWAGKEVVIGVRAVGANGRQGGWSNFVSLPVIEPLETPANLRAEGVPEGVRLNWHGAGPRYRVWRRAGGEPGFTAAGDSERPEFTDTATEYGKPYSYRVQALAGAAESELSGEADITPADRFPPAVPAGLTGVASTGSIELTWDRNTEPDLAGYRIYRATAGDEFSKIGETAESPSYGDRAIESSKVYRYAVSSVDKTGNESARSEAVEITAP